MVQKRRSGAIFCSTAVYSSFDVISVSRCMFASPLSKAATERCHTISAYPELTPGRWQGKNPDYKNVDVCVHRPSR